MEAPLVSKNLWIAGSVSLTLFSLVTGSATVGCSSSAETPDGSGDTAGTAGIGGTGAGVAGAPGTGGAGGAPGAGGSGAAAGGQTNGGSSAGGSVGTAGSGGVGAGGAPVGGGAGAGAGGSPSGGAGGDGSGGNVGPGPSDLPPPPGPDNVPIPTGTPGDIKVLDWAGFPAAVTYSFDDNDGSQLNYYDQLHALGGRYTFYLVSGWGINDAKWKKIAEDGNEIGNHTSDHSCSVPGIEQAASAIQNQFGKAPTTLAAPNGDATCATQAQGRVFINRGVSPAQPVKPLDNSNPFNLNCYIPETGQLANTYNANIDTALSQKGWVIYVIHGINPGTSHSFQPVSWEGLKGAIEYAKSKNVWIDTMENIGAYWLGQKAFAAATTQKSGDSTTWTWTLPDKFPPNKYLRVKVDGGTLTQDGVPLTWDPHGYYEIALDKKSVTLSP